MLGKFKKYWEEYSVVLALGAVLDPQIKLNSLEFLYSELDPTTTSEKTERVKSKLFKLYKSYHSANDNNISRPPPYPSESQTPSRSQSSSSLSSGSSQRIFDSLIMRNSQVAMRGGRNQLEVYLDEPNLEFAYYKDLDVLQWWRDTQERFPDLSIMARDLLSIPITTVASESTFSMGGRVLNKYRSRMLSRNVQALICTCSWLHGFSCDDEDDDEIKITDDNIPCESNATILQSSKSIDKAKASSNSIDLEFNE